MFVDWVRVIYTNPKSKCWSEWMLFRLFQLQRGVRQGNCLSPALFPINIELLAALIRKKTDSIKGIKNAGQIELKISLYVDDVLTYQGADLLCSCIDKKSKQIWRTLRVSN